MHHTLNTRKTAPALAVSLALMLAACGGGGGDNDVVQPMVVVGAKSGKKIIKVDDLQFKDLNANGKLDKYEDWRLPVSSRIDDLVAQMTDEEKAGMLMINDNNAGCGGAVTKTQTDFITVQKMTRFILRSTAAAKADACDGSVTPGRGGYKVTPEQLAGYANGMQEVAEGTRLGIPLVFKDNARNHLETDPRQGIGAGAGAFSQFPKEAGLAAAALGEQFLKEGKATTGDMSVIKTFTEVMGPEYNAVGLRAMYGYMADLLTDPRWYRNHEVFTENADLNANIMKALVEGLQGTTIKDGTSVNTSTRVALTMKHFPGGGPQELGMDPHYSYGKYQQYSSEAGFEYHLKPFDAAIKAGVSSIMPYYGIPMAGRDANKQPKPMTYKGVTFPMLGMSFSPDIVEGLLRTKMGFQGYVNSDTGIVTFTPWGMEWKDESTRVAAPVNAGVDTLSGYSTNKTVLDLVTAGKISKDRLNQAVKRLLKEQFQLGLFENPYVDPTKANATIGTTASLAKALEMQKKSVVLLQNQTVNGSKALPLKAGAKVYTIGFGKSTVEQYGYTVTDGNYDASKGTTRAPVPAGTDVAIVRVLVTDKTLPFDCKKTGTYIDPKTGSAYINPLTGKDWGAEDPYNMAPVGATNPATGEVGPAVNATCSLQMVGNVLAFGGALPWEIGDISFTGMSTQTSRTMYPTLADIKAIMSEIGDPKKVVLSIYFRAPYVLDDASGLKNAGAILATFGVSDIAMMDVLSGKFKPQGKMPFALPKTQKAVDDQKSDLPGFDETADGALFKFGDGLTY